MKFTTQFTEGIKSFGKIANYLEFLVVDRKCHVLSADSKTSVMNVTVIRDVEGLRPNESVVFRVPTKAFLHFVAPGDDIDFVVGEQDVVLTKYQKDQVNPSRLKVRKQIIDQARMHETIEMLKLSLSGKYQEMDVMDIKRFAYLAGKLAGAIQFDGDSLFCITNNIQMYRRVTMEQRETLSTFCASSLEFYKLFGEESKVYNIKNSLVSRDPYSVTVLRKEVPRVSSEYEFIAKMRSARTFTANFVETTKDIRQVGRLAESVVLNFTQEYITIRGANFELEFPLDISDVVDRREKEVTADNFLDSLSEEKKEDDDVVIHLNKWQKEILALLRGNVEVDVFPNFIKIIDGDLFIVVSRMGGGA